MPRLRILGGLRLEGTDFTEAKPLLVLAYLALEGEGVRSEIAERFFGSGGRRDLALKGLQEALRKLRHVDPELIASPRRDRIATRVACDACELRDALDADRADRVESLYAGALLAGVERNARARWSIEVEEWIVSSRERLHDRVQEASLRRAERLARDGSYQEAAAIAARAFDLGSGASCPTPDDHDRFHLLLRAGGRSADAERVRRAAEDLYGEDLPTLLPQQARSRLAARASLPRASGSFEGRAGESARLLDLLERDDAPVVSLVAPAGMGKTELAVRVAHQARARGRFARGLAFVPLDRTPVDLDAPSLFARIGVALGARGVEGPAASERLSAWIGERRTLVILDGLEEHVRLAPALHRWVLVTPAARVLVTSRRPLEIEGEVVVRLRGLDEAATVRLLGRLVREGAAADEVLARIARATGGVPLAVHLAAGWSAALPPPEVADRLESSAALLVEAPGGERLGSLLEDVWGTLSGAARATAARLVAFRSEFGIPDVRSVSGGSDAAIRELVDRGVLARVEDGYGWHALIRSSILDRVAAEERDEAEDRHMRHLLDRLRACLDGEESGRSVERARLGRALEDLEAAWRHGARSGRSDLLRDASYTLYRFADLTGRSAWAARLFEIAERAATDAIDVTAFRAGRAWFLVRAGRYDAALRIVDGAAGRLDRLPELRRLALNARGAALDSLGRFDEAAACFRRVLDEAEDEPARASAASNLGANAYRAGRWDEAKRLLQSAASSYRRHDRGAEAARVTAVLASVMIDEGDAASAAHLCEAELERAEAHGWTHPRMLLTLHAARARLALADPAEAGALIDAALRLARETDNREARLEALCLAGERHALDGDGDAADGVFAEAAALARASGLPLRGIRLLVHAVAARLALGRGEAAARAAGRLREEAGREGATAGLVRAARVVLERAGGAVARHPEAAEEGRRATLEGALARIEREGRPSG